MTGCEKAELAFCSGIFRFSSPFPIGEIRFHTPLSHRKMLSSRLSTFHVLATSAPSPLLLFNSLHIVLMYRNQDTALVLLFPSRIGALSFRSDIGYRQRSFLPFIITTEGLQNIDSNFCKP